VREVYPVISQLEAEGLEVKHICQTLDVSHSSYYQSLSGRMSSRQLQDNRLSPRIREIFFEHKRRYGARRIAIELAANGEVCGPEKTARLMRKMGLKAIQPRSFKPRTTDSRHVLGYSPNRLLEAPSPTKINQVWIGDITYVPFASCSFGYLAVLMDLHSRRIVGWELADHMQEPLVLAALRMAIRLRQPEPGLVHHTDRGGQYAAIEYRRVLDRATILQSMSRPNNCYDNAFMESCFGTIKTELEMTTYINLKTARFEITEYIHYYNLKRRHSALKYVTPQRFEESIS
jgi:transposase InsO family protein